MGWRTRPALPRREYTIIMLSALIQAVPTMGKHAYIYITALVVSTLQFGIAILGADFLFQGTETLLDASSLAANLGETLLGLLLIFISFSLTIYTIAWTSFRLKKNNSSSPPTLQLFRESMILSAAALLFSSATFILGTTILSFFTETLGAPGIALLILLLFFAIGGIVATAFSFTPVFVGEGFQLKKALAASYHFFRTNFFASILLLIGIMFVGGIISIVHEAAVTPIDNPWIISILTVALNALTLFYGATVLALATSSSTSLSSKSPLAGESK